MKIIYFLIKTQDCKSYKSYYNGLDCIYVLLVYGISITL